MNYILWLVIIILAIFIVFCARNKKEPYTVFGKHRRYYLPDWRYYGYYTRWFDRPWVVKNGYIPIAYNKYFGTAPIPYKYIYDK